MNTAIIGALLNNPSVLVGKFIAEPLAGAALAYGLVWLAMRPRDGRKIGNSFMWHSLGVAATVIGSAIFRIVAMVTFAGLSAYEPSAAGGGAGFYMLIVPAIIAVGVIAWIKNKSLQKFAISSVGDVELEATTERPAINPKPHSAPVKEAAISSRQNSSALAHQNPIRQSAPDDPELYGLVAKELASNSKDEGLWTMAFALESGDEAKTKAHYIRLRVAKLRHESVAQPVTQIAPQQTARVAEDRSSSGPASAKTPQAQYKPADKNELDLMQQAQQEFDSGQHDPEILAKAKSFSNGDASKVRDLYVRFRANALIDASSELLRRVEEDRRRDKARTAKELEASRIENEFNLFVWSVADIDGWKSSFCMYGELSPAQLSVLSNVARNDPSVVTLTDRSHGDTLLHLAAKYDMQQEMTDLLECGANPNAPDGNGRFPYQVATRPAARELLYNAFIRNRR